MRARSFFGVCLAIILFAAHESRAWLIAETEDAKTPQVAAAVLFEPGGDLISAGNLGTDQVVIRRHAARDGEELWRFAFSGITSTRDSVSLIHDGAGDLLATLHRRLADDSQLGAVVKLDPLPGSQKWGNTKALLRPIRAIRSNPLGMKGFRSSSIPRCPPLDRDCVALLDPLRGRRRIWPRLF